MPTSSTSFLAHRRRTAELMDRDSVDADQLRRSLAFIRLVNRLLGYTHATLAHLAAFSRRWRPGQRVDILDLATGSADVPRAILRWAARAHFDIHIVAIDRHARTIREAAAGGTSPRLRIVQADVFDLPFPAATFDYVITSMFLHHLDDNDIVRVLRTMDRLARRGIIAADLLRHYRAYAWVRLFTLFSNPIVRHDGPASVAQALTKEEVFALRDRAGLTYAAYHRHFGHRFVLAGEKGGDYTP